jgi:hypothetical protein
MVSVWGGGGGSLEGAESRLKNAERDGDAGDAAPMELGQPWEWPGYKDFSPTGLGKMALRHPRKRQMAVRQAAPARLPQFSRKEDGFDRDRHHLTPALSPALPCGGEGEGEVPGSTGNLPVSVGNLPTEREG